MLLSLFCFCLHIASAPGPADANTSPFELLKPRFADLFPLRWLVCQLQALAGAFVEHDARISHVHGMPCPVLPVPTPTRPWLPAGSWVAAWAECFEAAGGRGRNLCARWGKFGRCCCDGVVVAVGGVWSRYVTELHRIQSTLLMQVCTRARASYILMHKPLCVMPTMYVYMYVCTYISYWYCTCTSIVHVQVLYMYKYCTSTDW